MADMTRTHCRSITFADKMIDDSPPLGQRVARESPGGTAHFFFDFKRLETARFWMPCLEGYPRLVQMPEWQARHCIQRIVDYFPRFYCLYTDRRPQVFNGQW